MTGDQIVLSDGDPAPLLVECHPDTGDLAATAKATRPVASDAAVRASVVDGHLALFNLSGSPVTGTVSLPGSALHRGDQTTTADGSSLAFSLAAEESRVEPAWFTLVGAVPARLRAVVADAATLRLTAPAGLPLVLRVQAAGESPRTVVVPGGRTVVVAARRTRPYPLADLALGAVTFPTEPLPTGMSAPGNAVDDDPATSWQPGPDGRMVVDLGAIEHVSAVELEWAGGRLPDVTVETSTDGRTYTPAPPVARRRQISVPLNGSARYVAVRTTGDGAALRRLSVLA